MTRTSAPDEAGGAPVTKGAAAPPDRCGADERGGGICARPPEPGKRRCRRHGGAPGHGGQPDNRNALKHGLYTRDMIMARCEVTAILREGRRLMREMTRG